MRAPTAAAAIALVLLLAGCTADPTPTVSESASTAETGTLSVSGSPLRIVTSDQPEPTGMEALLSATMDIGDDGCVNAETGGSPVTLIWPKGYTVRGDSSSFEIVDADGNVVARSGTALAIGGGVVDSVDDRWGESDCATDSLWLVGEVSAGSTTR